MWEIVHDLAATEDYFVGLLVGVVSTGCFWWAFMRWYYRDTIVKAKESLAFRQSMTDDFERQVRDYREKSKVWQEEVEIDGVFLTADRVYELESGEDYSLEEFIAMTKEEN